MVVADPLADETGSTQDWYYKYGYVGAGLPAGTHNDLAPPSGAACAIDAVENFCIRSLEQPLTPQFMSPDGNGPPDLPQLQARIEHF